MVYFNTFIHQDVAARALAQAVADNLRQLLEKQSTVTLAVSGGRSPIAFFQALSQQSLDWQNVYITLVDERIVPTTDDDSNTKLVRQYLLQNQAQQAQWIPLIADEALNLTTQDVVAMALKYFKQPDIVILGMGNDGHTASLFPQAPQFSDGINRDYPQPLLHTTPITAPHERISMTLATIEHAQFVYLAIAGEEKKEIYHLAVQAENAQYPISYVLNSKQINTYVYYN